MGGTFASVQQCDMAAMTTQLFPSKGGITGLVKTIAVEWPEVQVKTIDFNAQEAPSTIASKLLQEITAEDEQVEVGYLNSRRLILQPVPTLLDKERAPTMEIDASWVLLITGGAKGITADVACALAKHYQPNILLVGRSPLPEAKEPEETVGLEGRELKAVLLAGMRKKDHAVTPTQVEAVYRRILKDREMRNNIMIMRSHGAKVNYYQVDVRSEDKVRNLINEIYQSYGRIDGVIHGVGILEDKLLKDKTSDSFDRVFDTKVDSAFILSRTLRPDSLKFFVLFSSVAGRFGNRGQCDYTAANEVYNKLAIYLDSHWSGRVVSIIWGPWARTGGMVSPELQKQFAKNGIVLVPESVGPQKLVEELRYGQKGEVEVIISGNQTFLPSPPSFPLIGNSASLSKGKAHTVEVLRYLDPTHDLYLKDHQLDGKPVLPMAMALELMAEVVAHGWPELKLIAVNNMQVLQGIIIDDGAKPIRVKARPHTHSFSEQLEVDVSIVEAENRGRIHYRATATLAKQIPAPTKIEAFSMIEAAPFPMSVQEVYRQLLFHGPQFQMIDHIERMGTSGIIASLNSSSPQQCVTSAAQGEWIIDPMVIDNGLQLILIWARLHWDMTLLPSRFLRYRRFNSLSGRKIDCHLHIRSSSKNPVIHADLAFFGPDGRLVGLLEDIEGTCSKSLNRLTKSHVQ
jgi:NAD(P)-dependent dehydrogenase (short-subunit alcohol dehydrogenase family)